MTADAATDAHEGGCHCGAVRFRVAIGKRVVSECNCSMCRKKAALHLIVPDTDFTLLSGEGSLTTYTFNTHVAQHRFCNRCGIHAFGRPRSQPDKITVNLRCLDEDLLDSFTVTPFDGQHWEMTMASRSKASVATTVLPSGSGRRRWTIAIRTRRRRRGSSKIA